MNKSCLNCKWYYNQVCNNIDAPITQEIEKDGVNFVEDGYFYESIREEVDFQEIIIMVLEELEDLEIIKKPYYGIYNNFKKILDKIDVENFKNVLTEKLDINLGKVIMNNLDVNSILGECDKLNIGDPDEFYCSEWQ